MWTGRHILRSAQRHVVPLMVVGTCCWIQNDDNVTTATSNNSVRRTHFSSKLVYCEPSNQGSGSTQQQSSHNYIRKRATLEKAAGQSPRPAGAEVRWRRRYNTVEVLNNLRSNQVEIMKLWERDEDGWRELPARAWPAVQPKPSEMEEIQKEAQASGCYNTDHPNDECQERFFQIATTLVFYNINARSGLDQFLELAQGGHVDAMVACGVILVEGLGVKPNEQEGIKWLDRAAKLGSNQACYELGTVYYTGITDVVDEDPEKAFGFFERAANENHVAAMYMMADCLAEGEGVAKDVARAVPLFYQAAEQGHRFARQRIRELLANPDYKK